jgi:hypothetical protein
MSAPLFDNRNATKETRQAQEKSDFAGKFFQLKILAESSSLGRLQVAFYV